MDKYTNGHSTQMVDAPIPFRPSGKPEVQQSQDARLSLAFVVRGLLL